MSNPIYSLLCYTDPHGETFSAWVSEPFYCNRIFPLGLFFGFLELELELEQKYSSSYLASALDSCELLL